mgnify:FL=1
MKKRRAQKQNSKITYFFYSELQINFLQYISHFKYLFAHYFIYKRSKCHFI